MHPNGKYEVKVRHRPSVLENVKSWKIFEDDKQIQNFLILTGDFNGLTIDEDTGLIEEASPTQEPFPTQIVAPKQMP